MKRIFLLSLSVLSFLAFAKAQNRPIVIDTYEQLDPFLQPTGDTTYVINFWATWCKPCVAELPMFLDLEKTSPVQPLKVILVSLDFKNQVQSKLVPFMDKNKIQPTVYVLTDPGANEWIPKVDEDWDGSIPVTLIRKGKETLFVMQQIPKQKVLHTLISQINKK